MTVRKPMSQDEETNTNSDALIDAISNLLSPLLNAMEALSYIGRYFHPPQLPDLVASVAEVDLPLRQG
ncbi:MAG: hypothetical protein HN394_23810, partial [Rhodospirillaceae bacterium]|nr:hypothetical protein [Rhodospirillaceae bacterium]